MGDAENYLDPGTLARPEVWEEIIPEARDWEEGMNFPQIIRNAALRFKTVVISFTRQSGEKYDTEAVQTRRIVPYSLRKSINYSTVPPTRTLLFFYYDFLQGKTESCNFGNIREISVEHDVDSRSSGAALFRASANGIHEEIVDQILENGAILTDRVPLWRPASSKRELYHERG